MILGGDIYQMHTKKRDLYLKKEDRGMVPGGSDLSDAEDRGMVFRRSMTDMISVLHQSDIPCSKGERLFRGRSKEFR
jgi:hypothetical protein